MNCHRVTGVGDTFVVKDNIEECRGEGKEGGGGGGMVTRQMTSMLQG